MKVMKRFTASLLAVIMIVSACCVAAFATSAKYPNVEDASDLHYNSYFCLGDSIATGYLTEQSDVDMKYVDLANVRRDGETTTNAYPTMIADALGLDVTDNPFGYIGNGSTQVQGDPYGWSKSQYQFYNYARDGYTSHEFRLLFDPSYYNQMTEEQKKISDGVIIDGDFTKSGRTGQHDMQRHIKDDLSKSDVITLWFGSNDLLMYPLQSVTAILNDQSITATVNGVLATFGMEAALASVVNTAVMLGKLPIVLATLAQKSNEANACFAANWDAILKEVNQYKKPEAKIYVGNIYNSNKNLKLTSTSQYRIGELVGLASQQVNQVIESTSAYRNTYTVVDTKGVEDYLPQWEPLDQWSTALEEGYFYTMFMVCAHPRKDGQMYLANEFIKAMKANA